MLTVVVVARLPGCIDDPRYSPYMEEGRDGVAARLLRPTTARARAVRHHRSAVCRVAARHGATNVRLFGSVARGDDEPDSDIDFVVDLPPTTSLLELIALRRELAELLDASVDVVPARSLRPEVAAAIEREAIPL